jgi:hypothetical protein
MGRIVARTSEAPPFAAATPSLAGAVPPPFGPRAAGTIQPETIQLIRRVRLRPGNAALYSTVERNTVAPPVAKFGTSATIAFHSGVAATASSACGLANQSSVIR